MQLRPHQTRAIGDVRDAFRRTRRVLLVAPTGFGKTAVSAQLIAWAVARGRRVLFLVHRREIVLDTHRRLPGSGLVMAGERVTEAPVQVASIQTVVAREQHPPADLVVWDEAHHCDADTACVADPVDTLLAAGWTPADTRAGGLWRDPADGVTRTEAHALRLVGKDAGEVRT